MHITETNLGISPLMDEFTFDDGVIITLIHTNQFIWGFINVNVNANSLNGPHFNFTMSSLLPGVTPGSERLDYADYIYYIVSCHLSYIRYYPSIGEIFNPYKAQYEYHACLDIKHKCRNLRKAGRFAWAHWDILQNIEDYNQYAKISRFCREALLNFYSRFLNLSILRNNKTLSWIIDETDSFIHYGFVMPEKDRRTGIRCGCEEHPQFRRSCVLDNGDDLLFSLENSLNADSYEVTEVVCKYHVPHDTDSKIACNHQQAYPIRTRYNKRVGVRQQTKDIVNMQLTDDQPFTINGSANYRLFDEYAERMTVKTRSINSFFAVLGYANNQSQEDVPTTIDSRLTINTDVNEHIHAILRHRVPLEQYVMDVVVKFLIKNKSNLKSFVFCEHLTKQHVVDLTQIALHHNECQDGKLNELKILMQQRKLMLN